MASLHARKDLQPLVWFDQDKRGGVTLLGSQ